MDILSQIRNPPVSSGLTSTSLDRAPAPSTNFVKGKSGFVPFWPGGMEDALKDSVAIKHLGEDSKGLKRIPPGFSRGLRFPGENTEDEDDEELASLDTRPRVHAEVRPNIT